MVSIKFWRGKFSRPATGYECIAHALAFDRGVPPPDVLVNKIQNYSRVCVTRVFLVFFRQQPETTLEQCSFDFRIPRRHDVDGNFLLRSLHVLMLCVCSTTLVSFLCLRFNSTATGHFSREKIQTTALVKKPFFHCKHERSLK